MSEVENKQESLETVKEDSSKSIPYAWNPDKMLEVFLIEPDNFLKIRETLTRIGIASRTDGKESNITTNDIERRNTIAVLMADWGLLKIKDLTQISSKASLSQIKVLAHKDKAGWELVAKYNIGKRAK